MNSIKVWKESQERVVSQFEIFEAKSRLCKARSAEAISTQVKLRRYPIVKYGG